jgi:hypothetical protein
VLVYRSARTWNSQRAEGREDGGEGVQIAAHTGYSSRVDQCRTIPSLRWHYYAMAFAISRRVVPRARRDLISRSIETLGSPFSILAMRD